MTNDFLARQIVDDLVRAGLDATRFQHVVAETLRTFNIKVQGTLEELEKIPTEHGTKSMVDVGCCCVECAALRFEQEDERDRLRSANG